GEAFGARIAQAPSVLETIAHRFRGAVGPLDSLATAMENAQAVIGASVRDHDEAQNAYAVLEDRVHALVSAGRSEADPEVATLRALQIQQAEVLAAARARHEAASRTFHDADRRCAATLSALAEDSVADPLVYRFCVAASSAGRGLGTLGIAAPVAPEVAPVALAGDVVGFGADASLLLFYGEGDLRALGFSALFVAMGTAGKVLRSGSSAGAEMTGAGARATRSLSTQERLVLGSAATVRTRVAKVRKAFDVPPGRGTPSHLTGGPPLARVTNAPHSAAQVRAASVRTVQRVRDAARARADMAFRDQLRMAMAGGTGPQRMYIGGVTLLGAERVGRQVVDSRPDDRAAPDSRRESG
ncbi:MAG: hypothetical protein WBL35_07155, partial [Ornithinibacter sp.]